MKKLFFIFFLFAIVSCSKNDYVDTVYDKTTVEFATTSLTDTISFVANEEYTIAVPIQIFGGFSSAKLSIACSSDLPDDAYFVESNKVVENGVSLDSIYVKINTSKIKKGKIYAVELTISDADIAISKNYATCQLTLIQQAFIDFFTGSYSCKESSTNSTYDVEFTKLNDTTVKNLNFWDFPLSGQYVPFIFVQDETFGVSIPENTEWTDLLGNKYKISGFGTYDLQGNFSVNFVMKDFATDEEYQSGTQVYKKK